MTEPSTDRRLRVARKITESGLRNSALAYLQRYASSCENLRRVLMRRVHRSAQFHPLDLHQAAQWVDAVVAKLAATGMLDDQSYAEGRVRALFRRGVSPLAIAQRLREKGVGDEVINRSLKNLDQETSDPNLLAAIKFAKRRRLGPYQKPPNRADRKTKDLAALARAGFDYQTAKRVITAPSIDEIESLARSVTR